MKYIGHEDRVGLTRSGAYLVTTSPNSTLLLVSVDYLENRISWCDCGPDMGSTAGW